MTLRWNFTILATATAWGRIEAHAHYPSDTLAGAALGNFLGTFIYDAFLEPANGTGRQPSNTDVFVELVDNGLLLKFDWGF